LQRAIEKADESPRFSKVDGDNLNNRLNIVGLGGLFPGNAN
jgi:hypothetical protein